MGLYELPMFMSLLGFDMGNMFVEQMLYSVSFCFAEGQYGEGCVFASTLCMCDLRKGDLYMCSELGQGATSVN